MALNIIYYPANFDGGGCYRMVYPGVQLKARGGHDVGVCPYTIVSATDTQTVMEFHLNTSVETELAVMQQPGHAEYMTLMKALQAKGTKVIVDVDDDYTHVPSYNAASKHKEHLPNLLWCIRHADAVTVTTPALRDVISKVTAAPIYVLRNFLDWKIWRDVPPVYEARDWDRLRIGYLGNMTYHGGDIEAMNPWLGKWIKDHPDVDFVAAGDPDMHDVLGVPHDQRLTVKRFVFRLQKIAHYVATMDIGLVPLVRNQFNEAKSHLKGMEYAGVGIPCLATPTESYRDWWLTERDESKASGLLCSRPKEWIRALDRLYEDEDFRRQLGQNARQQASEHTYQDHWRLWENVYHEVLGTTPPRLLTTSSGKKVDPLGVIV